MYVPSHTVGTLYSGGSRVNNWLSLVRCIDETSSLLVLMFLVNILNCQMGNIVKNSILICGLTTFDLCGAEADCA